MNTTELPYIFDLLYDIKTVEQLHFSLCEEDPLGLSDLIDLMDKHNIPIPEEYVVKTKTVKLKFLEKRHNDD